MPAEDLASMLLASASELISTKCGRNPSEADIRRAVSTSYYAIFHALARNVADCLVGANRDRRPNKAWVEVYRGLVHGSCKDACKQAGKIGFPKEIHMFADTFVVLQDARHRSDYDPEECPTLEEAETYTNLARRAIEGLSRTRKKDLKAFSAWVLITSPGARQARAAARQARQ